MKVIDETKEDIAKIIATDFGGSNKENFDDRFINWLHYRARRIPRIPRSVHLSREISDKINTLQTINKIHDAFQNGRAISPWLSDRIRKNKLDHKSDMMFNHWQISHFHLGSLFDTPNRIRRGQPLLYAHISTTDATFLDVQPHGAWTRKELLEILLRTNPSALEKHELRRVTPNQLTEDEYSKLRAKGGNTTIEISGRTFLPGLGITASGHALRIATYRTWFLRIVEKIRQDFEADQVAEHLKPVIYARIGTPVRLGAYYDDRGLVIIDKNRNGLALHQMKALE